MQASKAARTVRMKVDGENVTKTRNRKSKAAREKQRARYEGQLVLPVACRKTKLCAEFQAHGSCHHGEQCSFAHGVHELRVMEELPDLTRTKMCPSLRKHGYCQNGPDCTYAHALEELRCIGSPLQPESLQQACPVAGLSPVHSEFVTVGLDKLKLEGPAFGDDYSICSTRDENSPRQREQSGSSGSTGRGSSGSTGRGDWSPEMSGSFNCSPDVSDTDARPEVKPLSLLFGRPIDGSPERLQPPPGFDGLEPDQQSPEVDFCLDGVDDLVVALKSIMSVSSQSAP